MYSLFRKKYPAKVLLLVVAISLVNFMDRQILYAVFPLIKSDLGISDTKLGLLASAFILVYMLFSPLAGYFGDRIRRPLVIGVSAVLWGVITFFTGLIRGYGQLLFIRSLVGVGEAGFGATSPSYLAEWFPAGKRARVMAVYALAIPVGGALGYLIGGVLGYNFGWRSVFFIAAAPGIILGLMAMKLRENPEKRIGEHIPFSAYMALFRNRTYLLISVSMAVATFSVGGLAAWMPSYFVRAYGMNVATAGLTFGIVTVTAGIIGTITGGWVADWLRKRVRRAYFIVAYLSLFASVPFGVSAVMTNDLGTAVVMFFFTEVLIFMHAGPYQAAIVEVTPLQIRSMAFAVAIFVLHGFGDALSPTVIGAVSDAAGLDIAIFFAMLFISVGGVTSIMAGEFYMKEHPGARQ